MHILVTGASGFVGQHVVRALLARGHRITTSATKPDKLVQFDWADQVTVVPYVLSLAGDEQNLYDYFGQPDALMHLAWQGLPNYKSSFHLDQNLFPHYLFLKNLITNGLRDLTVTGTCFEYGMQSGCLSEELTTYPANPYGLAKYSLWRFLGVLQAEQTFTLKWARLFYMYGPGQSPNSILPLLERAVAAGEPVFNMSGGEQLRDYLPIEAVATYLSQILEQNRITGIINCCSGQPISVRRLVEEHIQRLNARITLNLGHYPYPDYEPMAFWGDAQKLQSIITQ
ncbi:NAD-dependent epimerase/dehydratase family protein [Fibrella forsythiae]|uniref:NAD-dependent epimerase/dehydratase family protein n=1 Tax=Fibrella forsythiae TaxID=2817061 RepID=A0ABS3JJ89_9BACT|nr:NAD-dependent epimerase/dehydratase family protein [Fibrella forsythiae]MBO0950060.1 NAD-dependent epimerase/dehydratase family protein [Fibrella forsythiae]